jgi:NTP pyrophosphatase (non-canonical NTP hydrolase)
MFARKRDLRVPLFVYTEGKMHNINNVLSYIQTLSLSDKKSLMGKTLKATEELGELAKVVLPYDNAYGTTHRFATPKDILEEVADLTLCALSIAYSAGFDTEDIVDMMKTKTDVWAGLQHVANMGEFPIPFEIHITVDSSTGTMDNFKATCALLNVKPIIIDLQADSIPKEVMTSSVIMTDNTGAYMEMKRISTGLMEAGFHVLREKIETAPYHPAAPTQSTKSNTTPPGCYFECHLNIHVKTSKDVALLPIIASQYNCHLSRNAFKVKSDNTYNQMMTLRMYDTTREDFKAMVDTISGTLVDSGLEIEKTVLEFAIYDSDVSKDTAWLLHK